MASMRNWGLFNVGRITIAGLWLHQDLGTLAARSNRQEAAELGHYKIANVDVSAILNTGGDLVRLATPRGRSYEMVPAAKVLAGQPCAGYSTASDHDLVLFPAARVGAAVLDLTRRMSARRPRRA
jgi:hypothetical protein